MVSRRRPGTGRTVSRRLLARLSLPVGLAVLAGALVASVAAGPSRTPQPIGGGRAPLGAAVGDPVIVAAGDIACTPGASVTPTNCHHLATSNLLAGATAVLTLGDNQYPDGTLAQFQGSFDPTWGRFKSVIRPSVGNHEYHTGGAAGYFDYFGSAAGDRTKGYYSYDLGGWHLIALNSNCAAVGGCGAGSPQEVWLRNDLAANPNSCVLAYWHHPRFSSGRHGSNSATAAFWSALYAAGADVVLNGHDHTYERFAPQTPAGVADPQKGIRQFIVGTGGRGFYTDYAPLPTSVAFNASVFGVLEMTLRPTGYEWRFVPEAGRTYADSGSATCVGVTSSAPVAAATSATTAQGSAVPVPLSATDAQQCELSFSIVGQPTNGTLGPVVNAPCTSGSPNRDTASVGYTPAAGFTGTDTFTYKANDGSADSNVATATITVTSTGAGYQSVVLADAPAGYWRLGETSGTDAADASGNGNPGAYQGAPTLGAPGLVVGGDRSVDFDGVNDNVSVTDSASLSPTSAVSVEAWVRADSFAGSSGGYRTVLVKSGSYWLRVENVSGSQRARFLVQIRGAYSMVTAPAGLALLPGRTYHLVGTYDGTRIRLYVDGALAASLRKRKSLDDSTSPMRISDTSSSTWDGRIDEAAVYRRALASGEIQAHYAAGTG